MSAAAVMAVVLFLFFLVGVAVGVLVVIALSARRAHKAVPQVRPVTPSPGTWPYLSEPDPDEGGPDEPPWWRARSGD
jgi:MFS superfamily sulfate permease-like transporter